MPKELNHEPTSPDDGTVATRTQSHCKTVILFDGVCNLCDGFVRFVLDRDSQALFQFASLQSDFARQILAEHGIANHDLSSVILVDWDGRVWSESTAVLRICSRLRAPWPLVATLLVIPRPLRDFVYRFVARNRYRWFGHRDECRLMTPELRGRFLDQASRL